jgi:AbrB family looped-hinge helix DNA binding protein
MDAEVVRLGKKGQLSVPREVMERLGLRGGEMLVLEVTDEGSIVLQPAGVYPLEVYSERRVEEFLDADSLSRDEKEKLSRITRDEL